MEEQAQSSTEMLERSSSRKAPTQTTMISLVKPTPKATTEQLCVVSTSSAKGAAPASAFGVQQKNAPPQGSQGTGSGCGVLPTEHKGFQQQRGSGVRKSTTESPGKVGYWVRGQQSHGGQQRPPASMTSPSSSPLDGAAGEA